MIFDRIIKTLTYLLSPSGLEIDKLKVTLKFSEDFFRDGFFQQNQRVNVSPADFREPVQHPGASPQQGGGGEQELDGGQGGAAREETSGAETECSRPSRARDQA